MNEESKKIKIDQILTRGEQIQVIQWCVELYQNQEIADMVLEKFDKKISKQGIWRYRGSKKWRPIIKRLRKEFERNLCRIPCANKAYRLKYLQQVITAGFKYAKKKVYYNESTDTTETTYEMDIRSVTQALKEARKEVEGERAFIDNSKHYHISAERLHDARQKVFDRLNKPVAELFDEVKPT